MKKNTLLFTRVRLNNGNLVKIIAVFLLLSLLSIGLSSCSGSSNQDNPNASLNLYFAKTFQPQQLLGQTFLEESSIVYLPTIIGNPQLTADTESPVVTVTSPTEGAVVSGIVLIDANATDNVGIAGVQFTLDGANLGAEDTAFPYSIDWNSLSATNSSHQIGAEARDAAGNKTTSSPVNVTVDNAVDTTPPTVTAVVPDAGAVDVVINTTVTATFSEELDPDTVNTTTFELRDAANNIVAATVSYDDVSQTASLMPTNSLANGVVYTATVKSGANGVKDLAGNALTGDYIWFFATIINGGNEAFPIIFVSRQIPTNGSVYYPQGGMLPGIGSYSRFTVAAPGKLIIREPNGVMRTLIDGSSPQAASLNLIDVNAPDVSYDGTKIVFAGLPDNNYQSIPHANPGAWRIYTINVDGTGLKQITFSDRDDLDLSQFAPENEFEKYDDTDPVWLPDGRIVFSSTRWPSLAQYNDERTTNLYVMNADGSNMRRITAERNGADRPLVDPLTGRIVYSRWWRNFRNAANDMSTIVDPLGDGYIQHQGLVAESRSGDYGNGPNAELGRNSWMLATINPDGTNLLQFAGESGIGSDAFSNQAYGGSIAADGSIFTAFYPMHHLSEAAGFGGIRHYPRGPHSYTPIIGIADEGDELVQDDPPSYRVFKGDYAADPEVLPNGRLLISWASDTRQDYGLYTINADGSDLTLVYDNPDTAEIRSRVVRPRSLPPIIPDQVTDVASLLPPLAEGPYDIDGTFTFNALNVFFNAPVDVDIVNAMPVGSAGTIRFFIDHQRTSAGFPERLDWPILLDEVVINPDGSVVVAAPTNLPLFEQIRSPQPDYTVPLAGTTFPAEENGAAHVAGHNFGRPGEESRCVGCHAGHSMIPVPNSDEAAKWTNLATGAVVSVSSTDSNIENNGEGLIDRRVHLEYGNNRHWLSKSGQSPTSQWIELVFPVPVSVRTVRPYNLPQSYQVQVQNTTIRLYSDAAASNEVAVKTSGPLSESGTDISFSDVQARVVRIEFDAVTGNVAGLAEVEVIARGEALSQ